MTPEKLHLALNHFVFLFPLAALVPLIIGLVTKNRTTQISGVIIALIGALITGVVMGSGEDAYERYENGPIAPLLDADAHDALEHHEHVAHDWSKLLYLLAVVSITALLIAWKKQAWLPYATIAVILFCVIAVAVGVYIADSGGTIRRPDFRQSVD
ncbi:MAG: hypothetical protein AAFX93_04790 [Verrucomicrobiota bacterium]